MADVLETDLNSLPLDGWHRGRGGRMVPFAGYHMPVQYEGIIAEHRWTRTHAGLFDVSHMGQILAPLDQTEALERLLPGDLQAMSEARPKYSLLLNEAGGILDDLMITRRADGWYLVVNGATKHGDMDVLRAAGVAFTYLEDQALLALQGPEAVAVIAAHASGVAELGFMQAGAFSLGGTEAWISRSGYTGEDGVEISIPAAAAEAVADLLLADERVRPIGLGARDSLRLEAGLPLYGHDLDETTTPVAADLLFAINKRRRAEGGFAGADRILAELEQGPVAKRVGFTVEGRQPVREGARILDDEGNEVGRVTSGGFSPSTEAPIGMGYVAAHLGQPGTALTLEQRGKLFRGTVATLPFVPHRYHRKGKTA
ncbi:glycine cleavage system aminomethyltransferase GcvT [Sphingomonas astaxanthinifaciens]|uniref:aminomethyltransferase n=1 Tax=Sphingomonas astaxanthinifaciens DSM 22298 TaxID=1123267 RepID=A0ABQ5Z8D1_9SPHN|nr:glycine cleavage system aminomethyltransferase GcvT [Sphingomonas astaxanthinifaciens]GLR47817.1 aminomethyltransferase [Sphingomonas astaxanthinifaciens DSM 22298]